MTEQRSARFNDLDEWQTGDLVEAMFESQLSAISTLRSEITSMSTAADAAAERLNKDGRLVYVGAGTSGRIAVLDGVELGPTFGWPAARVLYCLAGGIGAFTESAEGAEDDIDDGIAQIQGAGVGKNDVVIAIAASGMTPYTIAAVRTGKLMGALTIGIANNADTPLLTETQYPILAETGSEPLAGSTRMNAGTAQKAILSMLSTAIMVRLGRVYKGYMVDMVVSNDKLAKRAIRIVREISECSENVAREALSASGRDIKQAVLIALGQSAEDSRGVLNQVDGNLRQALAKINIGKQV